MPVSQRAPAAPKPETAGGDSRFENGPPAVIDAADGQMMACRVGSLVLDVLAESLP